MLMFPEIINFALLPMTFATALFLVTDGAFDYSEKEGFTIARPAVEGQAMAMSDAGNMGVIVAGLDERARARLLFERPEVRAAKLAEIARGDSVLLNPVVAYLLRAQEGDTVTLVVADGDVTPMGVVPRTKRYRVAGLVAHSGYGSSMPAVFLGTEEARTLLGFSR